jgi:hypothetical protein
MERTEITRPIGINKDLSPYELPPNVWSEGSDIHFHRNRTSKIGGYANVWDIFDTAVSPLFHIYFSDGIERFWVYASEGFIYKTDGATRELLASGFSALTDVGWAGCNFNGLILLNQFADHPQVIDPTDYLSMIDLPNWGTSLPLDTPNASPWGAASRASVIRPYKNYLLALDCYDETDKRYPSMIRWSSPAESGDVPPSWDPVALGEGAGLYTLADSPGVIVDGLTLGDYFMIYKTDAVHVMQFIGGDFTFSFRKLFGEGGGAISKECIAEFDGHHFVLSADGAYIHNGASQEDIMEPWVKDAFFDNVLPEAQLRTKVVTDHINNEIWIYFISQSSPDGWYDSALIWNWEVKEWTIQGIGAGISHIAEGNIDPVAVTDDSWDSSVETWDESGANNIWNTASAINPINKNLLLGDYTLQNFYANDLGNTYNGVPFSGYVKRIGIDFNDDESFKYVTRVTPHILGQNPVDVSLFAEDTQTSQPTLIGTYPFDPTIDQSVDCHVTGRYIGIQFEGAEPWTLTGYTLEWEPTGKF